jgi:hypothetical protein
MKASPLAALAAALFCAGVRAGETTEVELRIQNHLFEPAELVVPADTKVRVRIHNLDTTPEEFESWELNREKVILGGERTVIFVGPLPPGEYPFFGEFNPKTAQGKLIVQ